MLLLVASCFAACGQTVKPEFQFSPNVRPGESLTVFGQDMNKIQAVTLKDPRPGQIDLAAAIVQTTPLSVIFTVPKDADGDYNVALSPSGITPIRLTVTPPKPIGGLTAPGATVPNYRVYMPDGQIHSHSIRVYVTPDPAGKDPRLLLLRSHAVTAVAAQETVKEAPGVVAPGQQWTENAGGKQVTYTGTLFMFDLSDFPFQLKPMVRVTPVVTWTDGDVQRVAVGMREVNIGNIVMAISATILAVIVALVLIIGLSMRMAGNPILFLTGSDGHLSLAQTQIAFWTLAVGGVVLGYGLIRLDIPDIPESLLVLMGASLATGGIGFFKDAQKQQVAVNAGVAPPRRKPALGDLVRTFPATGEDPELSLAKAQMIFWTVLLLVLFVAKSILDGAIWDVPWALVALMGFSQAGYLAPKLAPDPAAGSDSASASGSGSTASGGSSSTAPGKATSASSPSGSVSTTTTTETISTSPTGSVSTTSPQTTSRPPIGSAATAPVETISTLSSSGSVSTTTTTETTTSPTETTSKPPGQN
jgi:hypothetical protein